MKFASRREAGERLAELLAEEGSWPDVLVLALGDRGHAVGEPVATALDTQAIAVAIDRSPDGPNVGPLPDVRNRTVIVVGDGVETGAAAHAVARALDEHTPSRKVLAVGVCPRDALATLQFAYDEVIAVHRPMGRRALTWHYADEADS